MIEARSKAFEIKKYTLITDTSNKLTNKTIQKKEG